MDTDKNVRSEKKQSISLLDQMMDNPVTTVTKLVSVTENILQERVTVWNRYRRKYRRGLYYLRGTDHNGVPVYFINYVFSVVETVKANLTRYLPPLTVRAKGEKADQLAANIMSKLLKDSLTKAGLKKCTKAVVHHGLVSSLGWFKVGYDVDAYEGMGGVVLDALQPEDVLVDPLASNIDDARWAIHVIRDVPYEEIYAKHGVMPESNSGDDNELDDDIFTENDKGYSSRDNLRTAAGITPVVDVYECWIRNFDPEKGPKWFICTIAGKTVVRELEPSPFNHDSLPFIPWFDVEDDAAENIYYRGVGEVEEIEPLQDRSDALNMRIYKNICLLANRQRFVSAQSGLNHNMIDNTEGRSYTVNGDATKAVYYDNPPMLSSDVHNYNNITEMLIQTVSGVFDVSQGRRPVGITAGRAIEALKDSADVRISDKAETFTEALVKVGELAMQIILQFYDGERIIKATDADEDEYVRIIDDYPDALQPGFDDEGNELEVDEALRAERLAWKEENGIDLVLSEIEFEWDIEASAESALPHSRAERAQTAIEAFRLGLIDREATLEAMEFPNRHKILQRLNKEVTGKNAGDPSSELGFTGQQGIEQIAQALLQMGLPEDVIAQIVQIIAGAQQNGQGQTQQMQVPQAGGQPQPGGYEAQITMGV